MKALPIAAGVLLAACETIVSDAATRIRYDLRDAADALRRSNDASTVVTIAPRSWPDGCSGARYTVRVVPYKGGKQVPAADVFVSCSGGRQYATGTQLGVAREMRVEKAATEPVRIELRKAGDDVVIAAMD